jgi:hypothetical protein
MSTRKVLVSVAVVGLPAVCGLAIAQFGGCRGRGGGVFGRGGGWAARRVGSGRFSR